MISHEIAADGLVSPQEVRLACREGRLSGTTRGLAFGFVQCNLVVIRERYAYDFLLYCQRNQRACPVLEVTDTGDPEPKRLAPGADLRTDLPRYAVYRDGSRLPDVTSIKELWRDDFVSFLIGSGISFDQALEKAGVQTTQDRWVLRTSLQTIPAGRFQGPLVVTMRWLSPAQAITATQVTARFPFNHGAPLHIGDPTVIGADLTEPYLGPPVEAIPSSIVPVFWACGVTPQEAALSAKIDVMITHSPGHGFVTDLEAGRLALP
ncbi:MAG: DUF1445 domain-containing protein [Bryobacterales bacterium]|nr:DUF1445 domain-containing protein [Bryobacterales bacterium]